MAEEKPKSKSFTEKAALVVTPGTAVLGLLYYFGATYWNAYYAYFGIQVAELDYSIQDYLLGSPQALFLPVWVLLTLGVLVFFAFQRAERKLARPCHTQLRTFVRRSAAAVGVALLLLGFPVFLEPRWWSDLVLSQLRPGWPRDLVPSLFVAMGAVLMMLALRLYHRSDGQGEGPWRLVEGFMVAVLAMVLFFDVARYARGVGESSAAAEAQRHFTHLPAVLVHARERVEPASSTIHCVDEGKQKQPFRYRCENYLVLAHSKTHYYLIPAQRDPQWGDVTMILMDDASIRVQVRGEYRGTGAS
ncbi:hypothetical protein ABZ770_15930 [Streptomyces sp. NPDC006654]|uniref:hypothetical protein n=1 Tax=unclassified Streptomyces TaxID=2593676 RepID=UPI0033CAD2A4